MIISTIKDGLGNQLFMYACGYAVARRLNKKLALDTTYLATSGLREYELAGLNVKYDKLYSISKALPYYLKVILRKLLHARISFRFKLYQERQAWQFDDKINKATGHLRLIGYWQSEKYFKQYRAEILKMLTLNYHTTDSFKSILMKMKSSNSVAVHVRRGDYVALGICLGKDYYQAAIRLIKEKVDNPVFYVFSDDMDYAKELFEEEDKDKMLFVDYVSVNATLEDFLLMKSCRNNITANSSYSWWGAWANENDEKIVVCPKRGLTDDFYPEEWIKL